MAAEVDRAQQDAAAPSLISERPSEAPKSETTDSHQPVVPAEPPATEASANGVRPSGVVDANAKAEPAPSEQTEDQGAAPKVSRIEPEPTSDGAAPVPLDTTAVADGPVQLPAVIPDKITPQDVEKAEDASVKMLAANLVSGTSSNGDLTKDKDVMMMDAHAESGPASQGALEDSPPVAGEKRKAEEPAEANGDANKKKPVLEEPAVSGEAAVGENPRGKTGRPKGVKKAPAAVGKTARRTRSQGAADL